MSAASSGGDGREAGPELDAAVARAVFGVLAWVDHDEESGGAWDVPACKPSERFPMGRLPDFSSDTAAAMKIFEAMVEMTGAGEIVADMEGARGEGFTVTASFGFDEHAGTATGPLPLAICEAALRAISAGRASSEEARRRERNGARIKAALDALAARPAEGSDGQGRGTEAGR